MGRTSARSTAGRCGWWSRTCTRGRAASGSAASSSWPTTRRATGRTAGTICAAIPSRRSGLADRWRIPGVLTVAALAMALPACLSTVPLDPKPQADLDPRLIGAWRCLPPEAAADDDPVNITIAPPRDRVYAITIAESGKEPDAYEAHGSTVG